jgi:GntR family transcriptional regulator, transcriptional repressor for pyruvate dehydrogenase complex
MTTLKAPTDPVGSVLQFQPATRRGLADEVSQQLIAEIERLQLGPGARFPSERVLMEAMRVGRSTIREALKSLEAVGLIEIRHGQGAFVLDTDVSAPHRAGSGFSSALTRGVTHDLIEARRPVELATARLAAERRTKTDIEEMKALLRDHQLAFKHDLPVTVYAARFHTVVAQSAHNEVLLAFVSKLLPMFEERGPILEELPTFREWELDQHTAIATQIRKGEPEQAETLMAAHLDGVAAFYRSLGAITD